MRLMLVTCRFGKEILGGGERYMRELMLRLIERGHEVEVYTTRSYRMIISPHGYLVWDNAYPAGVEEDEGIIINRFDVHNPKPRRALRMIQARNDFQVRDRESPGFVSSMAGTLESKREHCYLSGWHRLEEWEDGPARWTQKKAWLVVGGRGMSGLTITAYSYLDGHLLVETAEGGSWEFEMEQGKPRELYLEFPACDSVAASLTVSQTVRPPEDGREIGVAVRGITVREDGGERTLPLERGWDDFLHTGREEEVGKILWSVAGRMPRRFQRRHEYLMGPRSPRLDRQAASDARRFDAILATMVPMSSMGTAWRAARSAGKPLVAFPLFHSRDPNHYQAHFRAVLGDAVGVEANTEAIAELMRSWDFDSFAIGPGYDLDEFSSPHIDGGRFRREFGFGDRPILLWVARKNTYKGYPEAIAALRKVRESGCPAVLVMVGPDEDNLAVSGEGVYYLGSLSREKLLDAYDACDVFIFPSLHESFCLVFCEAWLRAKPVLGNAYCAAARSLIEDGENGYLCTDSADFARRALELIQRPEQARAMGGRGREKVLNTRGWDLLVGRFASKLEEMVEKS